MSNPAKNCFSLRIERLGNMGKPGQLNLCFFLNFHVESNGAVIFLLRAIFKDLQNSDFIILRSADLPTTCLETDQHTCAHGLPALFEVHVHKKADRWGRLKRRTRLGNLV